MPLITIGENEWRQGRGQANDRLCTVVTWGAFVAIYNKATREGGMGHFIPAASPNRAGIQALFDAMIGDGSHSTDLVLWMGGAALPNRQDSTFSSGSTLSVNSQRQLVNQLRKLVEITWQGYRGLHPADNFIAWAANGHQNTVQLDCLDGQWHREAVLLADQSLK